MENLYKKIPNKPLIRDLIIEGLSLARTQKEEFNSVLNSNDNDIKNFIQNIRIVFKSLKIFLVGPPGLEPGTNTL